MKALDCNLRAPAALPPALGWSIRSMTLENKIRKPLDNTQLLGIVRGMNITFSKAQVARATEVSQFDGKAVVARKTFGDHSRFCASLEKTRFGEPCVFILDADQRDENYPKLSAIVWQGTVDKLNEGIAFVMKKWGQNEVPAL